MENENKLNHTCVTCGVPHTGDITMDEDCGGCCSSNDKWIPKYIKPEMLKITDNIYLGKDILKYMTKETIDNIKTCIENKDTVHIKIDRELTPNGNCCMDIVYFNKFIEFGVDEINVTGNDIVLTTTDRFDVGETYHTIHKRDDCKYLIELECFHETQSYNLSITTFTE